MKKNHDERVWAAYLALVISERTIAFQASRQPKTFREIYEEAREATLAWEYETAELYESEAEEQIDRDIEPPDYVPMTTEKYREIREVNSAKARRAEEARELRERAKAELKAEPARPAYEMRERAKDELKKAKQAGKTLELWRKEQRDAQRLANAIAREQNGLPPRRIEPTP
jgi:hypothetical protein